MGATITADTTTNTLLIMAPPEQLEMVKAMLEKLDCMAPQVYIQAIIVEVSLTKDNSLGFEWSGLNAQYTRDNNGHPEVTTGAFSTSFGLGKGGGLGLTGRILGPDESRPPSTR